MDFYRSKKVLTTELSIQNFKSQKNTGIVTGCFDIIHYGHIYYLRKAKEIVGDNGKLFVIIHDDESIKQKKGEDRPINNLDKRIELLTELECVDFVIPWYGWENVQSFVMDFSPEYLIISEGESIKKNMQNVLANSSIKIATITLIPDLSSSSLLGKIGF